MVHVSLEASAVPLAQRFDGALVDLDGVVYWGSSPVAHASQALADAAAAGMTVSYLTNNASRTAQDVAQRLSAQHGVAVDPGAVVTASDACAGYMSTVLPAGAPVLVVGGSGLRVPIERQGFRVVSSADDQPAAVVQGFSPEVDWAMLAEATYAIRAGAGFYATNLDLTLPTERGQAPGNGSLVAAVRSATGVTPVSTGKPSPEIYRYAITRAGFREPLGVGDRLDTDIAGARAAGIAGLHVLTGVHGVHDLALAPPAHRPTFVAQDLRGLLAAHPAVTTFSSGTGCRGAKARFDGENWELVRPTGAPVIDLIRAAVVESWRWLDQGDDRAARTLPELP